MKSIDLIETYAYGTSKDLVSKQNNTKMINFNDVTKETTKEQNQIGGSGSGKTHSCHLT